MFSDRDESINIINRTRDDIISTNNTATEQLGNILDTQPKKNVSVLNLPDNMSGELDLSIISSRNFTNIKSINIGKGNITDILNIPSSVTSLYCADNLLVDITGLPRSLTHLNIKNNHISSLALTGLNELAVLNCSNNSIVELDNLPESLTELYCNNNRILSIDLLYLQNLRKLNIMSNADNLTVLNSPSSLEELLYDHDKMVVISHIPNTKDNNKDIIGRLYGVGKDKNKNTGTDDDSGLGKPRNYLADLNDYFKLKSVYEVEYKRRMEKAFKSATLKGNTIKTSKKMASKVMPLCVNCSAVGGTKFKKVAGKYSAVCGGFKKKCDLNIKIFTGVYYNFDELFQDYSTELENTKQEIITQKMDTLFNYIKEDVSADKFKKSLKDYSAKNEIFRDLMATNKLLNDNVHKKELIDKKMETIYGIIERMENIYKAYHKEHNPQLLKDIVYIKVKELDPEFLALRQIKYELCEMYTNDTSDDVLFQRENALSSITYSFDEIPHTIQYVK